MTTWPSTAASSATRSLSGNDRGRGPGALLSLLLAGCALTGCGGAHDARASSLRTADSDAPSRRVVMPMQVVGPPTQVAGFVRVTIHGQPYLLRVDTGAERTVVSAALARSLGLRDDGHEFTVLPLGCPAATQPVAISDWSLAGIPLPALAIAAQENLSAGVPIPGTPIAGLLGSDGLSRLGVVTLDYATQQLIVGGSAPRGRAIALAIHRQHSGAYETIQVRLGRVSAAWMLDTGAVVSLINTGAANRLHLPRVGPPLLVQGATGCHLSVRPVAINRWSTSGVALPPLIAGTANAAATRRFGTTPVDGFIGTDVLSQFREVTFDFRSGRLILGARG